MGSVLPEQPPEARCLCRQQTDQASLEPASLHASPRLVPQAAGHEHLLLPQLTAEDRYLTHTPPTSTAWPAAPLFTQTRHCEHTGGKEQLRIRVPAQPQDRLSLCFLQPSLTPSGLLILFSRTTTTS